MKVMRKIIEIDQDLCDGCGVCIPSCAEGAIELVDGKARLAAEKYCDGLGACLGECPTGALRIVEREAEDFDEEAVEAHLEAKAETDPSSGAPEVPQCPSARLQTFAPSVIEAEQGPPSGTALSNWPVQINLVPPTAPFLKGSDLLVVADCVPLAYAGIHTEFLPGKVVLMGCPKFDQVPAYLQKFEDIFREAGIKSITVLTMDVPCCSGLPEIIKRGMEAAGASIPMEEVVISTRGEVLHREK